MHYSGSFLQKENYERNETYAVPFPGAENKQDRGRTEERHQGEDDWFSAKFTDDYRLYRTDTMEEITRTDLYLKTEDDDEVVDLEEELENYRRELLQERLHYLARYLAKQALAN